MARELEIDRSTVTSLVPELLKNGIIEEVQVKPTGKGGRPPILLQINEKFGYTIGVAIHLKNYHAAILDLNGHTVAYFQGELPHIFYQFARNCQSILRMVEEKLKESGIPVIGAVIAISGTVDPLKNSIDRSFVFELDDYDFHNEIAKSFPYPVLVENDANAGAWGEIFPPWNSHYKSFLYLLARTTAYNLNEKIDTGMAIGIGLVADGHMLYGSHNMAGELTSVYWRQENGNESQVSIPRSRLAEIHRDPEVLTAFAEEILITLGPIASVIDPEAIIFGGDMKDKLELIQDLLDHSLRETYLAVEQHRFSLAAPSKGENEICAGAACLFLFCLFKPNDSHALRREMISWDKIFDLVSP